MTEERKTPVKDPLELDIETIEKACGGTDQPKHFQCTNCGATYQKPIAICPSCNAPVIPID